MANLATRDDIEPIKKSLLRGLRIPLGPKDGDAAFERHILLVVRFHRAARLNQTVTGEGKGWAQFFAEHFPKRPEWRDSDADLLWTDWRVTLVKDETPASGVTVAHGEPHVHWHREPTGTLCVNLESMWDDFERSVESFLSLLQRDAERRKVAVQRWQSRSWTVRPLAFAPVSGDLVRFTTSAAHSVTATAIGPPPSNDP
ncbi:MAG: hypothetical protein WD249_00190 [Gaiellaceae bacterium]